MNLRYILFSLVALGSFSQAALTPQDFAAGIPVRVAGEAPVQVATLPREVYQSVQRPDLGDLRVFDANGDEVPHALVRADFRESRSQQTPLPFFRLEKEVVPETLRLQLEGAAGTALDLSVPTQARAAPAAYLLDASALEGTLTEVRLEFSPDAADFLTTLSVEVSDDLRGWRPLSTASIARLQREDARLERTLIALPPTSAPYVRLTPRQGDALPPLEGVWATLASRQEVQTPLKVLSLTPSNVQTEAERTTFATGGFFRSERAELLLPQANTLVRADLFSSTSPEGPWTRRFAGVRYRLVQGGQEVTSAPMTFAPTTDPYWQVRVDGAGGGLGGGALGLELHYRPHTLLFLARGEGPYLLAYGSVNAPPSAFAPSDLAQALPTETTLADVPKAEFGVPVTLAGPPLPEETRRVPWLQILLWGVLVLGVGLLGWLAFGLMRRLDDAEH